ncbi:alanine racemase [Macrococcus hajekii]|uniref:Alanine racemase n=1 Tax=Macrococcus hajekii TaxID=198482 RepID=A0A4R6BHM0_9STAP|nr:alanine racemase [Macrococcus hajekii]TDM01073.1 alanine racemase [Macrococcus hajekii]GGB12618.1 alanine racemase 1 [Macrococcus hajekii]
MNHYRPSVLNIDLDHLFYNYQVVAERHQNKKTIAVIKADAYGMGAVKVAHHLASKGVDFFAVATMDEALELRGSGIQTDILILGIIHPEDINIAAQYSLSITVPGELWLQEALSHFKDGIVRVHVKIDTGMNRIGIRNADEYSRVLDILKQHDGLLFEGVYTHFACADMPGESALHAYEDFINIVDQHDKPTYIHSQNTAAALRYDMPGCNAVRLGIGLYGYYPSAFIKKETDIKLKPVMQLVSEINFVKDVERGTEIGYGAHYKATDNERIATIPMGYADGLLRSMSGYKVRVQQQDAEIVGRVCMDQTMLKVNKEINVGTQVIIIDNQPNTNQSMEVAEKQQQTISYEVLCNLGQRLPRIYHSEQETMVVNTLLK